MSRSLEEKLQSMDLVTQHLVQPDDLNYHHNLFGGQLLSWIDEGVAMFVMTKIRYTNIVTVSMDNVAFRSPGKAGDIIQIYACIVKTGRSSVKAKTIAITNNPETGTKSEVIESEITYVCLDKDKKPFPYFENFSLPT